MKTLLIVFDSVTGGARQLAEAAARGAGSEPAVALRMLHAEQAVSNDLLAADAYLFATPEMLAALSGRMKYFFDRTYYPVLERIQARPYALMVCAIVVCTHAQSAEAIVAPKTISPAQLARCEELGAAMAAGLAMGIF